MRVMRPILVVDDDPQMRAALNEAIERLGYSAVLAENGQEALSMLGNSPFAMVITDMKMPRMDGLSLLRRLRRQAGHLPVLVITGYGTIENAVETMKEGAAEYLMKPFSFDTLTATINSIMERLANNREIITSNPRMKRIIGLAGDVALSDTTVLVYGESGTGKELLARHIHRTSRRRERPFVAVNCASIPDTLMESELFGYEKGAFTGASDKKAGKFELADGGTLLLDEIGEMSLPLQAKLLRVLQEKEVDKIGAVRPIPVDVRVIATTNKDLYRESLEGRFREDLYYRLSVFPIQIPPLRERPEDIATLAEHFLKKSASSLGKELRGFTGEAMGLLHGRQWRGNVRELENAVHRAVLLAGADLVEAGDLMLGEGEPVPRTFSAPSGRLRDMEKELILKTLDEADGNKTRAARMLGVSVRTIRNKLNEYGKDFPGE
jgi:DNA-binding NtrC family response regulator